MELLRLQFLRERCGHGEGAWFVPRDSQEPVRNCSRVDRGISELIVDTIAHHLLTEHPIPVGEEPAVGGGSPPQLGPKQWNTGGEGCSQRTGEGVLMLCPCPGRLHLSKAAGMFDREVLSQLKRECGGLQTLLRNCHQVFQGGHGSWTPPPLHCSSVGEWSLTL